MSWFRFLQKGEITSSTVTSNNYKRPAVRRKINIPKISQDIPSGTWLFVQLNGLEIDAFYNQSNQKVYDDSSYLVVYTSKSQDDFYFQPVKSIKVDDLLFFQTAEDHSIENGILKEYYVYYKTKSIKDLETVVNGDLIDHVMVEPMYAEFETDPSEIEDYLITVDNLDIGKYSFSFLNPNLDWKNGISQNPSAKVIGNFTGPIFRLSSSKGPNFGKFEIRIIGLSSEATPSDEVVVDWQTVDTYNNTYVDSEIVYENTNLDYREYIFEIRSEFEKNTLSTNGQVKINSYTFLQDVYAALGSEELSPFLLTRVISGIR